MEKNKSAFGLNRQRFDFWANMANTEAMPAAFDVYALHTSKELPTAPASDLKNTFKPVFQRVLKEGAVSITRNRKREAVVLSAELYDQIIAELSSRDPLEILRKDYEARFASRQTESSAEAFQNAFDASSEELGKIAVSQANGNE